MAALALRCFITQELQTATESLFPEIDKLLENRRYQRALRPLVARRTRKQYRSMVDLLFCELFPEYQDACFAFYNDDGDPLRDILPREEVGIFNAFMLLALDQLVRNEDQDL